MQVKSEKLDYYKEIHANAWPGILKMIKECKIQNYSIYYRDNLLFSYFEYTGNDFDADMQKMADDPLTQKWWAECKPCQQPMPTAKGDEWWGGMEEVFHLD